jgi:hypothetical protein
MEGTSAAEAAHTSVTLSQRRRRCATQRQEISVAYRFGTALEWPRGVLGGGIFMKDSTTFADPVEAEKRARAIVKAATHFNDPKVLLEVSEDLAGDERAGCRGDG